VGCACHFGMALVLCGVAGGAQENAGPTRGV
jgi:hypothetical protein